jgi:hypothetical protein
MRRRSGSSGKPAKTPRRKKAALKAVAKHGSRPKSVRRRRSGTGAEAKVMRLTRELTEALQQQTATAEILQVVSSSPGDLQRVFDTMLESARRLCDAEFGNIYRWDGDALHLIATHNTPPAFAEFRRRSPLRPSPTSLVGRMVRTKTVVHVSEAAANKD